MTVPARSSAFLWYSNGEKVSYIHRKKSPGGILDLLEMACPAGDKSRPALPGIVLYEDLLGGSRVSGDLGGGRFDVTSRKGDLTLAAPNFATTAATEGNRHLRSLLFPLAQWERELDEASEGRLSFDSSCVYGRMFESRATRSAFRSLWALSEDEGAPSRLLARAAGCEILAELCRLGGTPLPTAKGGLAPWAERRCVELMHERLTEDISLDELAAEAQLSPFHFARMFKKSLGVPPRVYLTRLRVEKACELLEQTDRPITDIALEVGYSSSQVLARVFVKQMRLSPSDYRRAVRDPVRTITFRAPRASNVQKSAKDQADHNRPNVEIRDECSNDDNGGLNL